MATITQPTADDIRDSMRRINELFKTEVFGKRNFAALEQIYTRDARILPPGAPMISGRQAIIQFWSDLVQSTNASTAELATVEVMPAGNGILEIGTATISMGSAGQAPSLSEVKYVVYWQQEDGAWKWHVDIWNPNA